MDTENNKPEPNPSEKIVTGQTVATTENIKPAKVKTGRGIALFSLLLALIALAAIGYLGWLSYSERQTGSQLQADISAALQRVDEQAAANRDLQNQMLQLENRAGQQQQAMAETIADLQRRLASQQRRVQSLSTTDRDDWLLAEAEYLMRLANQRLMMAKDINGAAELLKAADAIALELDDAGLFGVRQALAKDLAKLRSAGRFDLEGIYLELGALAEQIEQLRLIELPEFSSTPEEQAPAEDWQQRLEHGFQAAWQKLSGYIQITRRDDIYKPLLAPEYEAAVRQNLRLMLEQAQQASLAGKQKLYDDSLAKAQQWLTDYYTLDRDISQPLIDRIRELSAQAVTAELPDISGSLRALKDYIHNLHELPASAAPSTGSAAEQPSGNETTEPSADKEPSANKKPSADKQPSADQQEPQQ